MKPIRFDYSFEAKVPPAAAWEAISATDKLNRSLGLPPVAYSKLSEDPSSPRLNASIKMFGLKLDWQEIPFEWVRERFFSEVRTFRRGPMRELALRLDFLPKNGGTELKVAVAARPRGLLSWLAVRLLVGRKTRADFKKVVAAINRYAAHETENPLPRPKPGNVSDGVLRQRLAALVAENPRHAELATSLEKLLRSGFDSEVLGIRPFELADRWGTPRRETLLFLLDAARAGLLDLRWSVLCPACKVPKARYDTLGKVKPTVHCDGCNVEYDAEFDRSVEARFDVNPAVRRAKNEIYCIGGPGNTPHVQAQFFLRPGEERQVRLPAAARPWKLRSYGAGAPVEAVEGSVSGGEVGVRLRNPAPKENVIRFEEEGWREKAATAAYITALPQFRDLFSSEVLAPGEEISVRNLAVMFTDLKESTAFYRKTGDARAYSLVREHFNFLSGIVEKHNGALVKTIGDAILAVFFSAVEAVRAAVEIQRSLGGFNREKNTSFVLKLGLHQGASIAVNANGRVDYFGSTMNIGARLEKESRGGDIVATQAVCEDAEVKQFLAESRLKQESLTARLRGIEGEFQLLRWTP